MAPIPKRQKLMQETTVDMRSDTVTKPTPEMRRAMAECEVGDDVIGDDPTVVELETLSAEIVGKEAALFVPSGTMGNLLAIMIHCRETGSEYIVGDQSHVYFYEGGGGGAIANAHPRLVKTQTDGTLLIEDIRQCIRTVDDHHPVTTMITVENSHNRCGGVVLPVAYMDEVGALAHERGIKFHVDGARLFNAAAALGVDAKRLVRAADSVSFCISKGLASPVGAMLCGTADFIALARRYRKMLGGGMRQAGVLAACGLVSLRSMVPRLPEDHRLARLLADKLDVIDGVTVDKRLVQSNLVLFELAVNAREVAKRLQESHGVLVGPKSDSKIRAVIHYMIDEQAVQRAADAVQAVVTEMVQQQQGGGEQ